MSEPSNPANAPLLSDDTVGRILRLGEDDPRPASRFDRLIERLTRDGGTEWLRQELGGGEAYRDLSVPIADWLDDTISLREFEQLKKRAKKQLKRANEDEGERASLPGATLAYLCAAAGAWAVHGESISSLSTEMLRDVIAELLPFTGPPLEDVLERALARMP